MFTVFFSHGTADYHIAESFKRELEQMKMAVYLFEHDRQPGYDIASKLQNAIERADIVVVLLTKGSQYSPYVHQEIGYAQKARKPIIPLVEPETDARALGMLAGKEYIPFDYNNADKSLSETQTYLHNQEIEKRYEDLAKIAVLVLLALALAYYVYTTRE
jgi:nucleoside 2-deoxyribosyltransferase